jgi:hypothetical protein
MVETYLKTDNLSLHLFIRKFSIFTNLFSMIRLKKIFVAKEILKHKICKVVIISKI